MNKANLTGQLASKAGTLKIEGPAEALGRLIKEAGDLLARGGLLTAGTRGGLERIKEAAERLLGGLQAFPAAMAAVTAARAGLAAAGRVGDMATREGAEARAEAVARAEADVARVEAAFEVAKKNPGPSGQEIEACLRAGRIKVLAAQDEARAAAKKAAEDERRKAAAIRQKAEADQKTAERTRRMREGGGFAKRAL
jgi:hypothetical protein